jgi:hypothetical protein
MLYYWGSLGYTERVRQTNNQGRHPVKKTILKLLCCLDLMHLSHTEVLMATQLETRVKKQKYQAVETVQPLGCNWGGTL